MGHFIAAVSAASGSQCLSPQGWVQGRIVQRGAVDLFKDGVGRDKGEYRAIAFRQSMKVIAFNGSPRPNGNTHRALRMVLDELEKEGIETELVEMGAEPVAPCEACGICRQKKDGKCKITDDRVNEYVTKIAMADGIIIGSPVYYGTMSAHTKAFVDRVGFVCGANGILKRKVGAAVAVNRRAGALATFQEINNFFLIAEMMVVGSSYWNVLFGLEQGDVESDEEGKRIMRDLGRNMAWLLKRIV